jgi:GNAT superfamily N-acetyltransferase
MNTPLRSWKVISTNDADVIVPPDSRYRLRLATLDDATAIQSLIEASARALSQGDYTAEQVEAALEGTFGVDTQLIRDGTYWVIEDVCQAPPTLAAAGGWSFRTTLCGGDHSPTREPTRLNPPHDAARIRAFFVSPQHARRGLGRMLLARCEDEAARAGFIKLTLLATLPGIRLYAASGYVGATHNVMRLGKACDVDVPFLPMHKTLGVVSHA